MDRLPKMFPDRLITFTGADFEVAGGSATSNSDLEEPEAEPEPGPSFDIENICHNGHVLANQYELVRTIFSYLPMRDLENCGMVNLLEILTNLSEFIWLNLQVTQLWNEVKRICMKERKRYDSVSFYWSGKCADVSYYSKYELFQSPHHRQVSF